MFRLHALMDSEPRRSHSPHGQALSHVDAMRIWESNTPKTCSANLNRPQVKTWNVWHGRHIAHPQTHQLTPTLEIHRNLDFFMWRNSKICTLDLALPRRCIPEAVHPSCPPCVWESPPKKTMVRSESFLRLWLGFLKSEAFLFLSPFSVYILMVIGRMRI
jgi:hypothetical protein